ncbi:MAG: TRL-like family protein [Leptospiraceae bacterium]|nr:TRL-like family protein [Leptospiraceae bacterium]
MKFVFLLLFGFLVSNCATGPVGGLLVTHIQYAGKVNPDPTVYPLAENIGCQYSILGLFAFGDSGAGSVANKKGIRRIAIIDYSTTSVLHFVFIRNCTIVRGMTY